MLDERGIHVPELTHQISMHNLRKDNLAAIEMANWDEAEELLQITKAARQIAPVVYSLPENQGKTGFVMVLTKGRKGYPNLTFQVGMITDPDTEYGPDGKLAKYVEYAGLKADFLKYHPEFMSSSQNLSLPEYDKFRSRTGQEIPAGAVRFMDDKIISITAFKNPNMDSATGLAIVTKAGLVTVEQARQMASDPEINCLFELESITSAAESLGLGI